MFALNEYVSYTEAQHTHYLTHTPTPPLNSLLLIWGSVLYPSVPLEKLFPYVQMIHNQHTPHCSVLKTVEYQHFKKLYSSYGKHILSHTMDFQQQTNLNSSFYLLFKQIKQTNIKSQRIISISFTTYSKAFKNLMSNDLFYYGSKLAYFNEQSKISLLLFSNVLRIQILLSIQSFIEHNDTFTTNDFMILPYTTKAKQQQHILVIKSAFVNTIQHFILCEWVSDSSSIRKNTMLVSPFITSLFSNNNMTIFSTIKTLLRWFCVSRTQYRGIIPPNEPGFEMYKYLPQLLSCFSIRRELSKYHTRKLVSPSSKKIDNNVPNFLRGLKSFLQLKHEHYIDYKTINAIHNFIHSKKYLQSVFPHVWDITNHIVYNNNKHKRVSLNDIFIMNGKNYPSFMFLYGMMLHKSVPKKIKQMIWLNMYTTTPMVLPSKLKGIEHMHRHQTIYKGYSEYVGFNKCPPKFTSNQEFLQLMVCLEYRSYMNPSKLSFKISNIPSIKLSKKPMNFPIMSKDKTKSTDDFEKKNYVYSNNSWVIRNIDLPDSFYFKREFLIDQLLVYQLTNSI